MTSSFFFYGDDDSIISTEVSEIESKLNSSNQLSVSRFNLNTLADIEEFYLNGVSISLFKSSTLTVVTVTKNALKGIEKAPERFIAHMTDVLNAGHLILIAQFSNYDKSTAKLLESSTVFSFLKKSFELKRFLKLKPWQTEELKSRISQYAKRLDLTFEGKALDLFLESSKDSPSLVVNELEKIKTYIHPEKTIKSETILNIYSFNSSINEVCDSLICGDLKVFASSIESIDDEVEPIYLIAAMQNRCREALKINMLLNDGVSPQEIASVLGIHPYRLKMLISECKGISPEYLKSCVRTLNDIEYKSKSGQLSHAQIYNTLQLALSLNAVR